MPFKVDKDKNTVYRCVVCGKIAVNPIFYKTCCMNKPVVFCSRVCAEKWIREWMRRQEQLLSRGGTKKRLVL